MELLFTNWLHNPDKIPVGWRWAYKYYYDVYYFKIVQFEKELVALDNELLYTLKPGARQGFCSAEFKTSIHINNQGFRDDETSSFSPEIICLGDSFTMGWGVEESESFPALLEKKTGRKVLNAGTPSYGTAREVMLFERLDISHLKCIIIQYCSNDIEENFSFVDNNYKLGLTSASAYKFSMASYELSRRYFPAKNFLMIGQLWVKRQINRVYPFFTLSGQPYDEIFDEKKHAESFMKTLFYLLQKVKDVQIVVTNIDVRKYKHNRFINELRRWLHKEEYAGLLQNVKFVDCDEVLSDKDYFTLDYHINVSGHKKVAEKLIYTIKAR